MLPSKLPVTYEIINCNMRLKFMDKNGRIYSRIKRDGVSADNLVTSDDWGTTWDTIYTGFTDYIARVEVLKDTSILVFLFNGDVFRSEDSGTSFTLVFNTEGRLSNWGGLDAYDNLVFAAPYQDAIPKKIFMSNDYGKAGSWKTILHITDDRVNHPHDVRYDPYENIIWTLWGDVNPAPMIVFSDNFGKTWQQQKFPKQYRTTNIMPLPDSVWFGSDEIQVIGAYRHERPKLGTSFSPFEPELYWAARRAVPESPTNSTSWATRPAIKYGYNGEAIAFWGYVSDAPEGHIPAQIYATQGDKVYSIWCQNKLPDAPDIGSNGIQGIWGPTDDGIILAMLYSYYDGKEQNFLKINLGTQA